jgi:hypothetical protein
MHSLAQSSAETRPLLSSAAIERRVFYICCSDSTLRAPPVSNTDSSLLCRGLQALARSDTGMSKRVCVIGAGACGLIATKVFAEHGLLPAVFEQSAAIGGQWRYDASVTAASSSAMYERLMTNLPSDVMQLSDFPFPPNTAAYPHHSQVLRYLEDYAAHWNLRRRIALNVNVVKVESQRRRHCAAHPLQPQQHCAATR